MVRRMARGSKEHRTSPDKGRSEPPGRSDHKSLESGESRERRPERRGAAALNPASPPHWAESQRCDRLCADLWRGMPELAIQRRFADVQQLRRALAIALDPPQRPQN